jgi:hypothetical protein
MDEDTMNNLHEQQKRTDKNQKAWPRTIIVELVKGEQLPRIEDNRQNERKNTKVQFFHH